MRAVAITVAMACGAIRATVSTSDQTCESVTGTEADDLATNARKAARSQVHRFIFK
jgi:hypothetical protein